MLKLFLVKVLALCQRGCKQLATCEPCKRNGLVGLVKIKIGLYMPQRILEPAVLSVRFRNADFLLLDQREAQRMG
jgi:hypothetical protein